MATNWNNRSEAQRRLGRIIDLLKRYPKTEEMETLMLELNRYKDGKGMPNIRPLMLYAEAVETIRMSTAIPSAYLKLIHNAEVIYNDLFILGENTPDFDNTVAIFKSLIGMDGLSEKGLFDINLYATFSDKKNYLTLMQVISTLKNAKPICDKICGYALEAREYFVEDMAYLGNLLRVVGRLNITRLGNFESAMEDEITKLRRNNGVYDIDPVRLAQVEKNVSAAELAIENGRAVMESLDRKSQKIMRLTDELDEKAKNVQEATAHYLDVKTENAKAVLEDAMRECQEIQRKSILMEKDLFLKQFFSDAETELSKYRSEAQAITSTASASVASLGRDADDMIQRLRRATENDDKLQKFVESSRKDDAILQKIEKLTVLNDSMIERMKKESLTEPARVVSKEENPEEPAVLKKEMTDAALNAQTVMPVPVATTKRTNKPIPPVNPLLDVSVPFSERYAIVQAEKKRRMEQGELFHEAFDDVITALMEDANPYLIGPSGCGKTYMINQIGQILGMECTDIGYINEEYDILGYVTAMGEYNESNFYRLYKYGGIAFCDELDNGNSKATVKLNSFLTNQTNACYFFPGGERVDRHANFRVIAAGNTDGSGANSNYSTREKIEESVQQRMIPIYVDYDNRVEKKILSKYPNWFEFACAFRKATDLWEESCGVPAQGIFTTRDAYRIKRYLDDASFTPEKIMNYEFVQTKEPEYLGFLLEELENSISKTSNAYDLCQIFANEVERIRKRGKRT